MKKYVFIGAYDKTDMLVYIAKILTLMNKKVLIIDTTLLKKSRYIVPTMVQEKQYITNYEEIDLAIGFESFEEIEKYQEKTIGKKLDYDIVLLDIDRAIAYKQFQITSEDRHYLVTSFDVYNVKRAVQVLSHIEKNALVTRIYCTKKMLQEEDEYLRFLAARLNINWDEKNVIYFPFETDDLDAIYVNQRAGRIQMKGLSRTFIDAILYLVEDISSESNNNVRKIFRRLES